MVIAGHVGDVVGQGALVATGKLNFPCTGLEFPSLPVASIARQHVFVRDQSRGFFVARCIVFEPEWDRGIVLLVAVGVDDGGEPVLG